MFGRGVRERGKHLMREPFGTVDGQPVDRFTVTAAAGMTVQLLA